jgi:hypothetical protein
VVVWHGDPGDGSETAVHARLFDAGGAPRGGQFQVNVTTLGRQEYGDVAMDREGNFVVVWQTRGNEYIDPALWGRRFQADGTPLGPEFPVNSQGGLFNQPKVEIGPDGGFMVVWMTFPEKGGDNVSDIAGRAFDAAGQPLGAEFLVNSFTPRGQYSAEVTAAPGGGFLVVWEGYSGVPPGFRRILGQRFDTVGAMVGSEFPVSSEAIEHSIQPAVAAEGAGGFVVAWTAWQGTALDIVSRRLDASGAARGPETLVNTYTTGTQAAPAVAADRPGNVVISWGSNGQDGDNTGVFARYFDCRGQALGDAVQVNTYTTGFQGGSRVAAAGGDFVVVWESLYGQDGSGAGLFGRRFRGAPGCGRFHVVTPCRLADTRQPPGPQGGPALPANNARAFPVAGSCGVPATARAVAVNVTSLQQTHPGNLRLYPAGEPAPLASTLNFEPDRPRANNALARLGASGALEVRCDMPGTATGSAHLVLDVFGYFE